MARANSRETQPAPIAPPDRRRHRAHHRRPSPQPERPQPWPQTARWGSPQYASSGQTHQTPGTGDWLPESCHATEFGSRYLVTRPGSEADRILDPPPEWREKPSRRSSAMHRAERRRLFPGSAFPPTPRRTRPVGYPEPAEPRLGRTPGQSHPTRWESGGSARGEPPVRRGVPPRDATPQPRRRTAGRTSIATVHTAGFSSRRR